MSPETVIDITVAGAIAIMVAVLSPGVAVTAIIALLTLSAIALTRLGGRLRRRRRLQRARDAHRTAARRRPDHGSDQVF